MKISPTVRWTVWLLVSLFYAYQYVIRVLPNIIMPEIMAKFQIDASLFGQFSGIYYVGYTLVHLPIGIMLDRMGPKYVIPACMMLTGLGLLPILYTDIWIYPILGRFIIGVGSSGAILGVFKIIRMCFPEERFTLMLGISVTIGLLGAIYGGQPVNMLLNSLGWIPVLQIICYVGVGLAIISYYMIPIMEVPQKKTTILQDVKSVITNPMVLLVCGLGGLMVGPLEGFADAWSAEFFRTVYHMSEETASTLPSFVFLGMCFGAPFLSYLATKTNAYYEITISSAVIMTISFTGILFLNIPVSFLSLILFLIGILCGYQILVIYKASSYVPESLVSLTIACANMIIMTFGYFFHTSIGKTMDFFWEGLVQQGHRIYSTEAFLWGLSIIPITLGIASVGFFWILLLEKRTQNYGNQLR